MKSLGRILVGLLLLGNLAMLVGLSVHVVRSPGGFNLVAKNQLSLVETYVDTRSWSPADLTNHPAVVSRVMQAGKGEILAHVTPAVPAQSSKIHEPTAAASSDAHQKSIFDFPQKK